MSIPCNCTRCGGDEAFSLCENAITESWKSSHQSIRNQYWIQMSVICLGIIVMAQFLSPTA